MVFLSRTWAELQADGPPHSRQTHCPAPVIWAAATYVRQGSFGYGGLAEQYMCIREGSLELMSRAPNLNILWSDICLMLTLALAVAFAGLILALALKLTLAFTLALAFGSDLRRTLRRRILLALLLGRPGFPLGIPFRSVGLSS